MPGFRKRGYKNAAGRYYRRRNMQAKKRQRRKFTRQQKVSIKTIKTIAKREAAKLDRKDRFHNWNFKSIGEYSDDVSKMGVPVEDQGNTGYISLTNRPTPYMIGAGTGVRDINVNRQQAAEVAGDDLVHLLLHKRKTLKIYCTGITVKGVVVLSDASSYETMYWGLCEVKVPFNTEPTQTQLLGLIETDRLTPTGLGYIKTDQTERMLLKNTRVLARKKVRLSNPNAAGSIQREFSFTVNFKKPKLIRYSDQDDDGEVPLNRFFWHGFFCQGLGDTVNQGQPPVASAASPMVCCNSILRYHEKLD